MLVAGISTRRLFNSAALSYLAMIHIKCRGPTYVRDETVKRVQLSDENVRWNVTLPDYNPSSYTAGSVLKQPVWADLREEAFASGFVMRFGITL